MTTVCDVRTIDSNIVGLAIAREVCPTILPTLAADGYDPEWYVQEPNGVSEFGVTITTVARNPINPSRQKKKGTITGLEAKADFAADLTLNNMQERLEEFFFADIRQKPSSRPFNGVKHPITSVAATDDSYNAAAGLGVFAVNQLIKASGFNNSANNGLFKAVTAAAGKVTVAGQLADEASPPVTAKIEMVGYEFPAGTVGIVAAADGITVTNSHTVTFNNLGLIPGEWIAIGGDATANRFALAANAPGYGRIKSIAANGASLVLDETTFVGATDSGAGKLIRIFFGNVLKNEKDPALIKKKTAQLELTLGNDSSDLPQAEYILGAYADDLTINIPETNKINIDLKYTGLDGDTRTGLEGIRSHATGATLIPALAEDAINTSNNIYRQRIYVIDPTSVNNTPLFGFLNSVSIKINNKITPTKVLGYLGGIDASVGSFDVTGSVNAIFSNILALRALRSNANVGFNVITSVNNGGMIFDLPLITLGGGRPKIAADKPIDLPLNMVGGENQHGYTLLAMFFPYLPNVLMAD